VKDKGKGKLGFV